MTTSTLTDLIAVYEVSGFANMPDSLEGAGVSEKSTSVQSGIDRTYNNNRPYRLATLRPSQRLQKMAVQGYSFEDNKEYWGNIFTSPECEYLAALFFDADDE